MIVCKNNVLYYPIDIELSNNRIECINGTVVMCNLPMILSLVYRPPQVPTRNLLITLSNVIDNVDDNDPMIILGDFNEDVMTNYKSVFMQNNGFCQCVLYALPTLIYNYNVPHYCHYNYTVMYNYCSNFCIIATVGQKFTV